MLKKVASLVGTKEIKVDALCSEKRWIHS